MIFQVRSSIARARHQQWWLSTMGQKHQSRLEAVQGKLILKFLQTFLFTDIYVHHRNDRQIQLRSHVRPSGRWMHSIDCFTKII